MIINVIPLQDNHDVVFQAHLRHAQTRNLNNFASKTSTTLLPTFATTFATTQPLNAPQYLHVFVIMHRNVRIHTLYTCLLTDSFTRTFTYVYIYMLIYICKYK